MKLLAVVVLTVLTLIGLEVLAAYIVARNALAGPNGPLEPWTRPGAPDPGPSVPWT